MTSAGVELVKDSADNWVLTRPLRNQHSLSSLR